MNKIKKQKQIITNKQTNKQTNKNKNERKKINNKLEIKEIKIIENIIINNNINTL